MDGDGKKPLKTKITNFYKLHMNIIGVFLRWKFMKETGQLRTGKHLSEELKSSKWDWSRYCHQNVWNRPILKNWKEMSMPQMKMD